MLPTSVESQAGKNARKKVIELLFPVLALVAVFLGIIGQIIISSSNQSTIGTAVYLEFIGNFALYFGLFSISALMIYLIDSFMPRLKFFAKLVHLLMTGVMFLSLGVILSFLFVLGAVGNNVSQSLTVPVSLASENFIILLFTVIIVFFTGIYFFEFRPLADS
jgi:hypothetical protein